MPTNTGTKLYFSGVESRRLLDTFKDFKVPSIQVSYFYLRKVFSQPAEAELYLKTFPHVVIDHGLIYHKYKSEPERKEFLEDYYNYVAHIDPKVYDAVVGHIDLTLDKVVAENKLIYPLDDLEDLFDGDTKSIFANIEYVGLSNKVVQEEDRMSALCSQALKSGTLLHAFGTASQSILKKWPIYSANTSSWRTGSRYANAYLYEGVGRGLKLVQPTDKSDLAKTDREKKNIRQRQKHMVETRQSHLYNLIDWQALLEEDDSWEVDKANLTQWLLYQQDLELEGRNAYWLSTDEKQELAQRKKDQLLSTQAQPSERRPSEESDKTPPLSDDVIEAEIVPLSEDITSLELGPVKQPRLREVDTRLLQPRMCDSCILANRCPKYTPGNSCAFGLTESYEADKMDQHIQEDMGDILALQKDRILQGYLEEKADGAGLNKDLNRELKTYTEMLALYKQAVDSRDEVNIKAKGTGIMQLFQRRQ